ncbi:hypothetical protein H4219_005816 [Mycoemilia scoparia]|uniref:DAGKc domain-containing protein n=1 Tax=Mycoemilia scoparia TaxID=417184 RepID=A0A9W7ZMV6_9FUNG|nr:hypothetical protein H4219_005816 [Mycoemilia scoparia]
MARSHEADKQPHNILILLNPNSGQLLGGKVYSNIVRPILLASGIKYELYETKYPRDAEECVKSKDLSQYTAIASISGDGLLHEIVNGLLSRKDNEQFKKIPLAIIPAGSGNGLAKSIECTYPEAATIAIIKGNTKPMDIMSVSFSSGVVKYCFLSVTWGIIADIDIESERLRWAGPARFDLYGLLRLLKLRKYKGRLHYLAADEADGNPKKEHVDGRNDSNDSGKGISPSPHIVNSQRIINSNTSRPPSAVDFLEGQDAVIPNWVTVDGPFTMVNAVNVPWLSKTFMAAESPRLCDGTIDLIYTKNIKKVSLMSYLTGQCSYDSFKGNDIHHVKVKALVLDPLVGTKPAKNNQIEQDDEIHSHITKPAPALSPARNSGALNTKQTSMEVCVGPKNVAMAETDASSQPMKSSDGEYLYRRKSVFGIGTIRKKVSSVISPMSPVLNSPQISASFSENPEAYLEKPADKRLSSAIKNSEQFRNLSEPPVKISQGCLKTPEEYISCVTASTPLHHTVSPSISEISFKPNNPKTHQKGIIVLDGEVSPLGPIKIECHPSLLSIITGQWYCETKPHPTDAQTKALYGQMIIGSMSQPTALMTFSSAS